MKKVVVTGGTGFVGTRLKNKKPNWIYMSSKDCDLLDYNQTVEFMKSEKPDAIIHLANKVGGIKENATKQAEFYNTNTYINTNVLKAAHEAGVTRVLSCLSTCTFPDIVEKYPFTEKDVLSGPPAKTNFTYGYTKRALYVQTNAYRHQYGVNYSTFCPSNIYGPNDNFDLDSSHFVPAMIRRVHEAKDGDTVEFWGTGSPLRQQLYVDDLVEIIPFLLESHNTDVPLIISPDQNLSIKEMIEMFLNNIEKDVKIAFNGRLDGQYRKDGSNKKFKELYGDFEFTKFENGVLKTYEWYKKSK
jgi:GDP-L-fucose synthase